jgi:hypothetical protein
MSAIVADNIERATLNTIADPLFLSNPSPVKCLLSTARGAFGCKGTVNL